MMWLTWRQHRLPIVTLAAVFLAVAGWYLIIGGGMRAALPAPRMSECLHTGLGCAQWSGTASLHSSLERLVLPLLPALLGMFVGAPLLTQEWTQRTYRYAWTQGVSRDRWLGAKLSLLGAGVVGLALVVSGAAMWWFAPASSTLGWFTVFDQGVLSFPAMCLFSFALGVVAGAVTKQTVLSTAAVLLGYLITYVLVSRNLRPHYMEPQWTDMSQRPLPPGSWDTGLSRYGAQDQLLNGFQPADRFWVFQLIEGGTFLGLSILCLAATFFLLRRRNS